MTLVLIAAGVFVSLYVIGVIVLVSRVNSSFAGMSNAPSVKDEEQIHYFINHYSGVCVPIRIPANSQKHKKS